MKKIKVLVKAEVLKWVRESTNIPRFAAAKKMGVKDEILRGWEENDSEFTLPKLRLLANIYKRSLGIFLLDTVPVEEKAPPDFRRTRIRSSKLSPEIILAIRRAREIQQNALELIEPKGFPTHASINEDPIVAASRLREILGVSLQEQTIKLNPESAFRFWKIVLEEKAGVLVLEQSMPQEEIRAFSLNHKKLPVIVINSKDENSSKTFSLFHETYHVMLGKEGVCLFGFSYEQSQIEVKCNQFAASFLVPLKELSDILIKYKLYQENDFSNEIIKKIASIFKVSRFVILGRLLFLDKISEDFYKEKFAQWMIEYQKYKNRKSDEDIFVNFADKRIKNNSLSYTSAVIEAYHEKRISKRDVASLLKTDLKHLNNIEQKVREGYGRYTITTS